MQHSSASRAAEMLYESVHRRLRPESVAALILPLHGWTRTERALLKRAAGYANRWQGWTSMGEDFTSPDDAGSQVEAVRYLHDAYSSAPLPNADASNAGSVLEFATAAGGDIAWTPERADFFADRLNREGRAEAGIELSKRQYNRRFRALGRLADKARRLEAETLKHRLILLGRSGFATEIPRERFLADPDSGAFVAYYTARRNARRAFTLAARDNPYDEIADMLFRRLGPDTDWGMVALAHPVSAVLGHLSQDQLGELLGRWSAVMGQTARILGQLWGDGGQVNRKTMVVRRGFDSSTWNEVAQAYNAARGGWIAVMAVAGLGGLLEDYCPPKAMRVMAADLAFWHQVSGSKVHPDTRVAAMLPLPWLVISDEERCSREMVEKVCDKAGVNPTASGWTGVRRRGKVASFSPTPELVHGVAVSDPVWANLLRRAGVFSGKGFDPEMMLPGEVPEGVVIGPLADFRFPPEGDVE